MSMTSREIVTRRLTTTRLSKIEASLLQPNYFCSSLVAQDKGFNSLTVMKEYIVVGMLESCLKFELCIPEE